MSIRQVSRPSVDRRTDYEPAWPAEEFIVPLLRGKIEEMICTYAVPAL